MLNIAGAAWTASSTDVVIASACTSEAAEAAGQNAKDVEARIIAPGVSYKIPFRAIGRPPAALGASQEPISETRAELVSPNGLIDPRCSSAEYFEGVTSERESNERSYGSTTCCQ